MEKDKWFDMPKLEAVVISPNLQSSRRSKSTAVMNVNKSAKGTAIKETKGKEKASQPSLRVKTSAVIDPEYEFAVEALLGLASGKPITVKRIEPASTNCKPDHLPLSPPSLPPGPEGDWRLIDHDYTGIIEKKSKGGRPLKDRRDEELRDRVWCEMTMDETMRRQVNNKYAVLRHREKKRREAMRKEEEKIHHERKNSYLKWRMDDLKGEINYWRERFINEFHFLPKIEFEDHQHTPVSIASQGRTNAALILNGNRRVLSRTAQLRREMVDLAARNGSLRTKALRIYSEILAHRKKMNLDGVKTSADEGIMSIIEATLSDLRTLYRSLSKK